MSQITEKVFRKSLNNYKDILWFLKLQVLPMTFTKSPADFIVLTENYRYLVECKECDCRINKYAFKFDRVTQLKELLNFQEKHPRNKSYILIMFRDRLLKDSDVFMIPIDRFMKFKLAVDKKSGNRQNFLNHLEHYRMSTKKSCFKLGRWFE